MPYVITTRTPIAQMEDGRYLYDRADHATPDVSCLLVAKLSEARDALVTEIITKRRCMYAWNAIGKVGRAGGAVTLQDGTMLEVEPISRRRADELISSLNAAA